MQFLEDVVESERRKLRIEIGGHDSLAHSHKK